MVPDSLEGPIALELNLGSKVCAEELEDYAPGDACLADIGLYGHTLSRQVLLDPAVRGLLPASAMRLPGATNLSQRLAQTTSKSWDANVTQNPLTAWNAFVASCSRLQKAGQPDTLVSAQNARRQLTPAGPLDPAFASANPSLHLGREVVWNGRLAALMAHQGETHFLVTNANAGARFSAFEAFTRQARFLAEVPDYLSSRDTSGEGDVVTIRGKVTAPTAAGFRLSNGIVLLDLAAIERAGFETSKALVGHRRDPATLVTNRIPTGLSALQRDVPAVGTEVKFTAFFCSAFRAGEVVVSSEPRDPSLRIAGRPAEVRIAFPKVPIAAWSDYAELCTEVEVVAEVRRPAKPSRPAGLNLVGKSIVRPRNPRSLVTAQGRPIPPPDYTREKAQWEQATPRSAPVQLRLAGLYGGYAKGPSKATITLERIFFVRTYRLRAYQVTCPSLAPEAEAFLGSLPSGEEIVLEVVLTAGSYLKPQMNLLWMARAAEPDHKVLFAPVPK